MACEDLCRCQADLPLVIGELWGGCMPPPTKGGLPNAAGMVVSGLDQSSMQRWAAVLG